MSKDTHSGSEHGTMNSYVVGFLLSLIFTFIPYYLVTNETVSGNGLLATILSFAVLQMLVQIIFFLHLGRGPKPNWNLYFLIGTVGIVLFVVGGSILIINNLHYNMAPTAQTKKIVNDEGIAQVGGQETGACKGQYENHQIVIKNGAVTPHHTDAKKCDTLTFVNQDEAKRIIGFGEHPAHDGYAGEDNIELTKGHNETITLSELGTYEFHDHLSEQTSGEFTVTE